jgi:DNA-binding SARP family transcriptional activator
VARLDIRLLGGFEVRLLGQPVVEFESDTVRVLLARMAVEPGRTISRASLAELLWPGRAQGAALGNLRHALAVLRRAIGDEAADRPFLTVTPTHLTADGGADVWIDVVEMERVATARGSKRCSVADLEHAVDLYRGAFIDGLDIDAGELWDSWLWTTREAISRQAAEMLRELAELRERNGERVDAERLVRRWLEIDPWDESAHRLLMRLLATDGRSAAAAAHADRLIERLRTDMGVEPEPSTLELARLIRAGRFPERVGVLPSALFPDRGPTRGRAAFVDRDADIDWLDARLDEALAGNGRLVLIAGEAGAGKSMLMGEFANRAAHRMPRLVAVRGRCNAYTGAGDPYLPFRQILGSLCGDLQHSWVSGSLTATDAIATWNGVPDAVDAVLDEGPYLFGSFLDVATLSARIEVGFPGSALAQRLQSVGPRLESMAADPARQQRPVLDQYTRVVQRIAGHQPLLLLIDDLQWADAGTTELVWHLAQELDGWPILVVAAYRPEEVAPAEHPTHPLAPLLHELNARDPDATLQLGDSRAFVDAWLDAEPNLLDESFRRRLFAMTRGHPLFTVEMIQGMRDRSELGVDGQGRWVPQAELDWDALPPRIEAVIAARVAALPAEVRDDLEVASIQGETFAPTLVASVRDVPAAGLVQRLGHLAAGNQPLVEPESSVLVGDSLLERYRFRHLLFQRFLYRSLSQPARAALHAATGRALEDRAVGGLEDVAVDLAHHFDQAGEADPAIEYHGLAGRRSMALSATTDAIGHLERALELLDARASVSLATAAQDRGHAIRLLTALGSCLQARLGYTAPQTDAVYERIRSLSFLEGATIEAVEALGAVVTVDVLRARYREAASGTEHLLDISRRLGMPLIEAVAHMQAGLVQLMTGHPREADRHLRRAHELYDPATDGWLTFVVGQDVGATTLGWWAAALWELGQPEQARRRGEEAIALARQVNHPFSLAFALAIGGSLVSYLRGEPERVLAVADEVENIADREDFAFYRAAARVYRGLGAGLAGDVRNGLDELELGLAGWKALGTEAFATWVGTSRADLLLRAGRVDDAAAVLDELDDTVEAIGEEIATPRLWLERGRVLLARGDEAGAERLLRSALALTDERGAYGPGLQIAAVLAQLLQRQGRHAEARDALQPVLERFVEGDDTPDVSVARALLGDEP